MTAKSSWAQRFLAPFKEPTMHDDDQLQSGAGGGEPLHPDQDNAPTLADAEAGGFELISLTPEHFREAVRVVYPGHPHAGAAIERHIADPTAYPSRSAFDRSVIDNCRLHLFRTL